MTDEVARPADAYFEMAELLGANYFLLPIPHQGKELVVIGRDGIRTQWCVTAAHGHELTEQIRDHPHLRLVASRRYPVG